VLVIGGIKYGCGSKSLNNIGKNDPEWHDWHKCSLPTVIDLPHPNVNTPYTPKPHICTSFQLKDSWDFRYTWKWSFEPINDKKFLNHTLILGIAPCESLAHSASSTATSWPSQRRHPRAPGLRQRRGCKQASKRRLGAGPALVHRYRLPSTKNQQT
jgi:hypothetical protein